MAGNAHLADTAVDDDRVPESASELSASELSVQES